MSSTTTVEIPPTFSAFEILPRDDAEERDERMPKTVAHAYLIMMQTNETESAQRTKMCMERYLALLAAGPTGSTIVDIGQGCLCWSCGHTGLPANSDELKALDEQDGNPVRSKMPPAGPFPVCRHCKSGEKTNFIIGRQGGGEDDEETSGPLPFLEASVPIA